MNKVYFEKGNAYIDNAENFDLAMTFDCGQCFRWNMDEKDVWSGIAFGKPLKVSSENGRLIFHNVSKKDFDELWNDYFDLNRDYQSIISDISGNEILKNASSFGKGIRILNQEPFETLCSFIISQNNNIPRIKGIIDRLCTKYGEKSGEFYTFPTPETLSGLTEDDLADIRMGFRTKYILDAARKVNSGEIDLNSLFDCDIDTARDTLMKIKGVGPKVADCTLLFSLKHFGAFPKDVWIKKAMATLFPKGLPECALNYGGIVQQYIFYYSRSGNIKFDD